MSLHMYCVKTSRETPRIGEAVKHALMQAQEEFPAHTVTFVAAIPRVLENVRPHELTGRPHLEVTEADVLLEVL